MAQGETLLVKYTYPMPKEGIGIGTDGQMVTIVEGTCLEDWFRNGKVEVEGEREMWNMADFATWVVKLGHRIAVQMTIRHEETGKDFKIGTQVPVEVRRSGSLEGGIGSSADHDEDLPRYGDDVKPPDVKQ